TSRRRPGWWTYCGGTGGAPFWLRALGVHAHRDPNVLGRAFASARVPGPTRTGRAGSVIANASSAAADGRRRPCGLEGLPRGPPPSRWHVARRPALGVARRPRGGHGGAGGVGSRLPPSESFPRPRPGRRRLPRHAHDDPGLLRHADGTPTRNA